MWRHASLWRILKAIILVLQTSLRDEHHFIIWQVCPVKLCDRIYYTDRFSSTMTIRNGVTMMTSNKLNGYELAIAVSKFSVFSFAPRKDLTLGRQSKAVFAAGIDGELPDEDVLDGFQKCGTCDWVSSADTETTSSTIARCIHLRVNTQIVTVSK